MRVEPKTEHQEKMDAWIADMENDRKETTACQDAMEANLEKIEPNLGEQEAAVERQEIPNEEIAIHSLEGMPKRANGLPRSNKVQSRED
jgi:hypothetical protein